MGAVIPFPITIFPFDAIMHEIVLFVFVVEKKKNEW